MTVKEIAKAANCSPNWVYKNAKKLGKLPTVEYMLSIKGKIGRPKKYWKE